MVASRSSGTAACLLRGERVVLQTLSRLLGQLHPARPELAASSAPTLATEDPVPRAVPTRADPVSEVRPAADMNRSTDRRGTPDEGQAVAVADQLYFVVHGDPQSLPNPVTRRLPVTSGRFRRERSRTRGHRTSPASSVTQIQPSRVNSCAHVPSATLMANSGSVGPSSRSSFSASASATSWSQHHRTSRSSTWSSSS